MFIYFNFYPFFFQELHDIRIYVYFMNVVAFRYVLCEVSALEAFFKICSNSDLFCPDHSIERNHSQHLLRKALAVYFLLFESFCNPDKFYHPWDSNKRACITLCEEVLRFLLSQDAIWTSIQRFHSRYERQMDFRTTLCAYWVFTYLL